MAASAKPCGAKSAGFAGAAVADVALGVVGVVVEAVVDVVLVLLEQAKATSAARAAASFRIITILLMGVIEALRIACVRKLCRWRIGYRCSRSPTEIVTGFSRSSWNGSSGVVSSFGR